ncbi:hypothetical protein [Pantoea rodasii]
MATGFGLLMMSALLFSLVDSKIMALLIALVLMGAGWAAILGPSVAAALAAINISRHAQGIGISWTLHNLGGAMGLAVATQIYQAGGSSTGFQHVMFGLAGSAGIGMVVAWLTVSRLRELQIGNRDQKG